MRKGYEIIIVSRKKVLNKFIPSWLLKLFIAIGIITLIIVVSAFYMHYEYIKTERKLRYVMKENKRLKEENAKIVLLERKLEKLSEFRKKVENMLGVQNAPPPFNIEKLASKVSTKNKKVEKVKTNKVKLTSANPIELEIIKAKKANIYTPYGMPVRGYITRGFTASHKGVDIAAQTGTPIIAPANGIVIKVTYNKRFGNLVVISHGDIFKTVYGHLEKVLVKPGDIVKKGDLIGLVGNTGLSTGPHLHYEIWKNGKPVNPMNYLKFLG